MPQHDEEAMSCCERDCIKKEDEAFHASSSLFELSPVACKSGQVGLLLT